MTPKMQKANPTYWDQTHHFRVCFIPTKNIIGYSHRVLINDRPAGWLSDESRPNASSAGYFLGKFGPYIDVQMAKSDEADQP